MKHLEHYLCFSYGLVLMLYLHYRSTLNSLSFRKKEKAKYAQMAFPLFIRGGGRRISHEGGCNICTHKKRCR